MSADDAIIRDLEIMSDAQNYNEWIYDQCKRHIGQRIVEVGAGIGNFTSRLIDRELVLAIDDYGPCTEYLRKRYFSANNIVPLKLDISSPQARELNTYQPDTIICINVLEHVQNDKEALLNMFSILPKGGRLIILVPAFNIVYGTIDRIVGHYRRYAKSELKRKLVAGKFAVLDLYYMNSIGLFGWLLNNRLLLRKEESPAQVKLFDSFVVPWLRRAEYVIRPPFGLSVVAIAIKDKE